VRYRNFLKHYADEAARLRDADKETGADPKADPLNELAHHNLLVRMEHGQRILASGLTALRKLYSIIRLS
jgi:hypothetical protein